ncbi:MAG: hypothetical protein ACRC76_00260 [Proteocatella sp.]
MTEAIKDKVKEFTDSILASGDKEKPVHTFMKTLSGGSFIQFKRDANSNLAHMEIFFLKIFCLIPSDVSGHCPFLYSSTQFILKTKSCVTTTPPSLFCPVKGGTYHFRVSKNKNAPKGIFIVLFLNQRHHKN